MHKIVARIEEICPSGIVYNHPRGQYTIFDCGCHGEYCYYMVDADESVSVGGCEYCAQGSIEGIQMKFNLIEALSFPLSDDENYICPICWSCQGSSEVELLPISLCS
jgi:hypothetical protein